MSRKKVGRTIIVMSGLAILLMVSHLWTNGAAAHEEQLRVEDQVRAITPLSTQMVEQAMAVLEDGWTGLGPLEKKALELLYDPGHTGEVDSSYVADVRENYQRIHETLKQSVTVRYEPDSNRCLGQRLYYTDLVTLHVCPYFLIEQNPVRKARVLIHEMAHKALLVADRPYYQPGSEAYARLTPTGSNLGRLPVVGPLIREILRADTLYHPDAYAHFAVAVSGQPGALQRYLDPQQAGTSKAVESASRPVPDIAQLTDAWTRVR